MDVTNSTAFKLNRATSLISRVADLYLTREHGISYSLALVLLMVRVLGPSSQQAVAAALDVSRASVSQRVSALVERGLLQVEAADGRTQTVRFTDEGSAFFERAWAGLEAHQSGLEAGVDERVLGEQLDRIISNGTSLA